MRQYILFLLIMCALYACKDGERVTTSRFPVIKIINSSGDDFYYVLDSTKQYFAPYPFNVGIYQSETRQFEVMLISKRLDKNEELGFQPIAKLTFADSNNTNKNVIIAIPLDDKYKIIESTDFYDFTVEQFSFKQIVEYWYSNRYGLQGTSIKGWSPASMEDLNVQ